MALFKLNIENYHLISWISIQAFLSLYKMHILFLFEEVIQQAQRKVVLVSVSNCYRRTHTKCAVAILSIFIEMEKVVSAKNSWNKRHLLTDCNYKYIHRERCHERALRVIRLKCDVFSHLNSNYLLHYESFIALADIVLKFWYSDTIVDSLSALFNSHYFLLGNKLLATGNSISEQEQLVSHGKEGEIPIFECKAKSKG